MKERLTSAASAAAIYLCFGNIAVASAGLPGPDVFLGLTLPLAPVAFVLLGVAYFQSKKGNLGIANLFTLLTALYATLLGMIYVGGISYGSGKLKLAALAVLALLIVLMLRRLTDVRFRNVSIWLTAGAIIIVALSTPSIVNYRYYTIDESNPLTAPNDVVKLVYHKHIELSDGKILRFDERISGFGHTSVEALVNPVGNDRFHVVISRRAGGIPGDDPAERKQYRGGLLHIPLIEVVLSAYELRELGEGQWIGEQKGKNLRLYVAAGRDECPDVEIVSLLKAGADPNDVLSDGRYPTALYKAIFSRCTGVVDKLIEAGSDVRTVDDQGNTPLLWAVRVSDSSRANPAGYLDIIRLLIGAGASVHSINDDGNTPLHIAAEKSAAITKLLLEAGAGVDRVNRNGKTPLARATEYFRHSGLKQEGALIVEAIKSAPADE